MSTFRDSTSVTCSAITEKVCMLPKLTWPSKHTIDLELADVTFNAWDALMGFGWTPS